MKKIVVGLSIVLVLGASAGSLLAIGKVGSNGPSPKDVAQSFSSDLASGNTNKADSLFVNPNNGMFGPGTDTPDSSSDALFDDILKRDKITWGNETIDGNSATVSATVQGVNFLQLMGDVMKTALVNAFANALSGKPQKTEKEIENAIQQADMVTSDTKLNLTKTPDGWKISSDNKDFASALFGRADKALQLLNSTMNSSN